MLRSWFSPCALAAAAAAAAQAGMHTCTYTRIWPSSWPDACMPHTMAPFFGSRAVLGFVLGRLNVHFGNFSMILDGFELNFWTFWLSGGSQGLPWGALGSPWAPGCPQQGFNERKAGSLDPLGLPIWGHFGSIFATFFNQKRIQKHIEFLMYVWLKIESTFGQF